MSSGILRDVERLSRRAKRRPRRHLQPLIRHDPHAHPHRFIRGKLRLLQTQLRLAAIILGSIFIHNEVTPQAASCSTHYSPRIGLSIQGCDETGLSNKITIVSPKNAKIMYYL